MPDFRLTADDLENAVLSALGERGVASVRDLYEQVGAPAGLVYTTIAKVVDRLRDKGLVERSRSGAAFVYAPAVQRKTVESARARHMVDRLLGVRPRAAVAALVEAVDDIDPQLLHELERAIRSKRRSGHGT